MKNIFIACGFSIVIFTHDVIACSSNSECSNGQVCCYVASWSDAQACNGHFLCGIGGGNCCVNDCCVSGCCNGQNNFKSKPQKVPKAKVK